MENKKVLNISSIEDLEIIKNAILNNEHFELGEIKPLTYKITLKGGRFEDYDLSKIDANLANIIIISQKNYDKFLKEIEKQFKISFTEEQRLLKFEFHNGSIEAISDIFNIFEVLKNMESLHQVYTILGLAGMWFSHSAYLKNIEKNIKNLESKERTDIVSKSIESMKEVALNKTYQDSINNSKKEVLETLENNESLTLNQKDTLHKTDVENFTYSKPIIDDIEPTPEFRTYRIKHFDFELEGKPFKIKGISPLVNSATLSFDDRMKLIEKAANGNDVDLKIKFILDGITKKDKEAYILEYKTN